MKPHYVQYDADRQQFLAWSSITGEMFYLREDEQSQELHIEKIQQIPELYGVYVRPFTIMGDEIWFVSGHNDQQIITADIDTLTVHEKFSVPAQLAGMVQLIRIMLPSFVLPVWKRSVGKNMRMCMQNLDSVREHHITCIDGRYYMTHHRTSQNIIAFDVIDNVISNVQVIY